MANTALPINDRHPVVFSFPTSVIPSLPKDIRPSLKIHTGADAIHWSYNLISQSTPTYGGEVVQVLGVNTGPITIQGTAKSPRHIRHIYHWFRDYMTWAGTNERHETAIYFKYPTRGWSFRVHVVSAEGFQYGLEQQHAIPWSITCEVLEDGASKVEAATMEQFNGKDLFSAAGLALERQIGFNPEGELLSPSNDKNLNQGGSDISSTPYETQFRTAGDNFQTMVAAWSYGDNTQWSFDALRDPTNQFGGTSSEYWTEIFGTDSLTDPAGGGSGAVSEGGSGSGDPETKAGRVNLIVQAMEEKGIPGQLGVALAIQESNLNADARQSDGDYAVGLFQTFPTGAGGSRSHSTELSKAFNNKSKPVTDFYTVAMQIEAASEWIAAAKNGSPQVPANPAFSIDDAKSFTRCAQWAQAAQRAGVDYRYSQRFKNSWAEAATEIKKARSDGGRVNADGLAAPLPGSLAITSKFGVDRGDHAHGGIDMVAPADSPIFSVSNGKAVKVVSGCRVGDTSCGGGFGNQVQVLGDDGALWIYAHMKTTPNVRQGSRVSAGQSLGVMGNTGHSYGDHLHLERHVNGSKTDPEPTIQAIYRNQR